MTMSRWSYLCVVGVLLACANAQSSVNETGADATGSNSSDVTTTVPSSTASMDSNSTSSPSSVNATTPMPSSTNETSSSSTSGQGGVLVPQFVEQPPSFPPPPPPAQFNPVSDDLPDQTNPNVSTTTTTTTTTTVSSPPPSTTVVSVLLSSSSPSSISDDNVTTTTSSSTDDATDANLTTSGNWMPGKFPPPGMTSAADSGNGEITTPSTTPLTVVEVGNVPTAQNDEKQKYDVNNWNNAMPNDAPADSQTTTKGESVSTVSYSKEGQPSAQQKKENGSADTRQAHFGLLAVSFLLALICNSRM